MNRKTEILIAGGCAAARLGRDVTLVEATPWIGGKFIFQWMHMTTGFLWGRPPGLRPTPSSDCWESLLCSNSGTRGSRADQGVCPT